MSHQSRPRALRALSAGVLAALTLGLTAGVPSSASATAYSATYENTAPITIVDDDTANPYPSAITVPAGSMTSIGDVSVTLHGLTHSYVRDLDIELVSPSDTSVYLMCDQQVGGKDDVSNVDVTFSTDGSGEPECDLDPLDLVDLALEDPAGDWSLYVDDMDVPDAGQIAGGWSLSFNQSDAPVVTTQPRDVSIPTNRTATFTATASGAPKPFVQWQVSTDDGANWSDVAQATEPSFSVLTAPSNDGNQYRAEFYSPAGDVFTDAATLHMDNSPSAPRNVTAAQLDEQTTRVTWSEPSETGNGIWGYRVSATSGSRTVPMNVWGGQNIVDLSLEGNKTWAISVVALWDIGGKSDGPAGSTTIYTRMWPTLGLSKTSLVSGDSVVLKGTGLPNETLTIQKNVLTQPNWSDVLKVTTDAAGNYQVSTKVDYSATYHVLTATGLYSNNVQAKVASKTSMAAKRVATRKYTLSGTLAPKASNVPVKISYRKASGAYGLLGTVRTGSTGKWSYTRKFTASKTMVFKASIAATARNTAGSKLLTVKVR